MNGEIKHYECKSCGKKTSAIDLIPECRCGDNKKSMTEVENG